MPLKFVYVLVSDEGDYYAEQAAISIHSLRMHNADCHVAIVMDESTFDRLEKKGDWILEMADDIITRKLPSEFTQLQKSRYLKTSLRQIMEGDFLFIDCDTVILGNLDELKSVDYDMGVALRQDSYEWNISNPHRHVKQYNLAHKIDVNNNHKIDRYFNSGVIYCKDNVMTREIYMRWHSLWLESSLKYGYHQDQIDLCRVNAENNDFISILDGKYNCQIIYPRIAVTYLSECKIFHYFSTSSRFDNLKVKKVEFLRKVREEKISRKIDELVQNIRREYFSGLEIKEKDREIKINSAKSTRRKQSSIFPRMKFFISKKFKHGLQDR